MKQKYVANGKRQFKFSMWWVLAIGYHYDFYQWDKYNMMGGQTWYFLCFKLTATQFFQKEV